MNVITAKVIDVRNVNTLSSLVEDAASAGVHHAAIWMIDTSIFRVHQHGVCNADWTREHAVKKAANIPPKGSRNDPTCFGPHLCRARNGAERFFNQLAGCEFMSPHPRSAQIS
jgi:hypothetical protein